MKKVMFAIIICVFTACNLSTESNTASDTCSNVCSDSVVIDTAITDSVVVDTTVVNIPVVVPTHKFDAIK